MDPQTRFKLSDCIIQLATSCKLVRYIVRLFTVHVTMFAVHVVNYLFAVHVANHQYCLGRWPKTIIGHQ